MRILLRGAILVFWAGMMAALYARVAPRVGPAAESLAPLPREAVEEWQGVYSGDRKIGWAMRRRTPIEGGFALDYDAVVRLNMMGASRLVRTRVAAETDPRLRLREFDFRLSSGTIEFVANGAAYEGGLDVTLRTGPQGERKIHLPLSGPLVLPQTLHERFAGESLESGRTFTYSMFDPLSAAPVPVTLTIGKLDVVEIGGVERKAFAITEEFRGSEFTIWVAPDGKVLRESGPLGLTLVAESRERATGEGFGGEEAALDLTKMAAIPVGRRIPAPRDRTVLRLKISGAPPGQSFDFPPRQTADGGIVEVRREEESSLASFPLPARDSRFAADLVPTTFLQSDDPRIAATSREILTGENDAARAARKLADWVFTTLAKVPTVSVPSALEVLDSRQGDCNEHAVLYAALARAAGLPAKVVAGTVYMPGEGGGAGAFYYHAWNEVWLGRWTAVDPTFGQFPADATHVKFLEGGPETHAGILSLVGRLRFELVEDPAATT